MRVYSADPWTVSVDKCFSFFLSFPRIEYYKVTLTPCTALLLFISCHLLNWEWQGLAEADNELGVETVRVRPCRREYCHLEWLIGQSVSVFEYEFMSVTVKIVCSGTLMGSFMSSCWF